MPIGIKKWFMLQMWRLQQMAAILTLALLALNLSLQLYGYIGWREGTFFSSPFVGVPIILLILAGLIWGSAVVWDIRMKMWREQMTVLTERNPYSKEKLSSKEVALYALLWLPIAEELGKSNPKLRSTAETLRAWLTKSCDEDPTITKDVGEIFDHIGQDVPEFDFHGKV